MGTMNQNPIVENLEEQANEKKAREAFRYPFNIVGVYLDRDDNDFDKLMEVRDFCKKNYLPFSAREIDFMRYDEDRWISQAPAIHIYLKREHIDIFYTNTQPILQIQATLMEYKEKKKEKELRKKQREERWNSMIASIKRKFTFSKSIA